MMHSFYQTHFLFKQTMYDQCVAIIGSRFSRIIVALVPHVW